MLEFSVRVVCCWCVSVDCCALFNDVIASVVKWCCFGAVDV